MGLKVTFCPLSVTKKSGINLIKSLQFKYTLYYSDDIIRTQKYLLKCQIFKSETSRKRLRYLNSSKITHKTHYKTTIIHSEIYRFQSRTIVHLNKFQLHLKKYQKNHLLIVCQYIYFLHYMGEYIL